MREKRLRMNISRVISAMKWNNTSYVSIEEEDTRMPYEEEDAMKWNNTSYVSIFFLIFVEFASDEHLPGH
jgi:hypothetical protein